MNKVLPELKEAVIARGYDQVTADKLVELIEPFVGYGFNRSHAACYAYIAYQMAYFKTYYPLEFFTGLLSIFGSDPAKIQAYVQEARTMGIEILPPDINLSQQGFMIEGEAIRFGLGAVKGLGAASVQNIFEHRPYYDMEHLITTTPKKGLNKKSLKILALSGALDSLVANEDNRQRILEIGYTIRGDKDDISVDVDNFNKKVKLEFEREYLNIYMSGHPLDSMAVPVEWENIPDDEKIISTGLVIEVREIITKKGDPMAFLKVEFMEGVQDMVCFPIQYADVRGIIKKDMIVKFECHFKYNVQRDDTSLIIDKLTIPKRVNKHLFET